MNVACEPTTQQWWCEKCLQSFCHGYLELAFYFNVFSLPSHGLRTPDEASLNNIPNFWASWSIWLNKIWDIWDIFGRTHFCTLSPLFMISIPNMILKNLGNIGKQPSCVRSWCSDLYLVSMKREVISFWCFFYLDKSADLLSLWSILIRQGLLYRWTLS